MDACCDGLNLYDFARPGRATIVSELSLKGPAVPPTLIAFASPTKLAATPVVLRFSGSISKAGVSLSPTHAATGLPLSADAGSYLLRLSTADRRVITQHFQTIGVADARQTSAHFFITIADPGALTAVEILKDGQSLYSEPVTTAQSASQANSGEDIAQSLQLGEADGKLSVRWDSVTYPWLQLVHVAHDGKRTVQTLNAQGGELLLPLQDIPVGGSWEISLSSGRSARLINRPR